MNKLTKYTGTTMLASYLAFASGCGTLTGAAKGAYYGAIEDVKATYNSFSKVSDKGRVSENADSSNSLDASVIQDLIQGIDLSKPISKEEAEAFRQKLNSRL